MKYRRTYTPGASYFFTLVTFERRAVFDSAYEVSLLRQAFKHVRDKRPFEIDAIVVLPDHIHCIWTLPDGDTDYSTRWRLIKTWFTKHSEDRSQGHSHDSRTSKKEQVIWQRRFWEHQLRDENDYQRHVDYIHFNPVKHGFVSHVQNWPYSSFHKYVQDGLLPLDWAGGAEDFDGVGRE